MDNRDISTTDPSSTPITPLSAPPKRKEDSKDKGKDLALPQKILKEPETKEITELTERTITPAKDEIDKLSKIIEVVRQDIFSISKEVESMELNHRLAANFLGDSFIKEATLQEGKLEGSHFIEILPVILEIFKGIQKNNQMQGKSEPFIDSMIFSIKQMLEIDSQLVIFEQFHKFIVDKITQLKKGESFAFPGGWAAYPWGHSIVNELKREEDGNFSLKVYNTGEGIQYHSSAIEDNQIKFDSSFIIKDITKDSLLNKEVWQGYFLLKTNIPKEEQHSARDYYEGFLRSIKPGFVGFPDQTPERKNLMRGARAGFCSVDSFRAFMRAHGNTKEYKSADIAIKLAVLEKYFLYLEKTGALHPSSKNKKNIEDNLGALRLIQDFAERLSHDISIGIDHSWIPVEEAEKKIEMISRISEGIKAAIEANNRLYVDSFQEIQFSPDKSLIEIERSPPIAVADITTTKDFEPFPNYFMPIIEKTDWLKSKPKELLKNWMEIITKEYSSVENQLNSNPEEFYKNCDKDVNRFISEIFSKMPNVNDPYWEQIPDEDKEECLCLISNLSEHLVRTQPAISNPTICNPDQMSNMQKALGVSKKLINLLPNDPSGLKDANLGNRFIQLDYDMEPRFGWIIANTPDIEQGLVQSTQILSTRRTKGRMFHTYWLDPIFQNGGSWHDRDVATLDSEDIKEYEKFPEEKKKTNEIYLIYNYIEKHPEVKQRIKEKLQKDYPDVPVILPSFILAEALTDLEGKYLPKSFCAFRKQLYLTAWFIRNGVKDAVKSQYEYCNSVESLLRLDLKIDPLSAKVHITQSFITHNLWEKHSFVGENFVRKAYRQPSENNPVVKAIYNKITREYVYFKDHRGHLPTWQSLTSNKIMLDKPSFNSIEEEEYRELKSIILGDPHNKVAKILAFFNKNLNKLIDSDYQLLFQYLIFELGILRKQLVDHPDFVLTLIDFVKRGYSYALGAKNNVAAALFFLRMGNYFDGFCKDIFNDKLKPSQDYQFPSIPQTLRSLSKNVEQLPSQEQQLQAKCLIARDFLAYYSRENLPDTVESNIELLKCAFLVSENLFDKSHPDYDPDLNRQVRSTLEQLAQRLKHEEPKVVSEILSKAVGDTLIEWNFYNSPLLVSKNGQYRIDLLNGSLEIAGYRGSKIPNRIAQNDLFKILYPESNELKNIKTMGINACSFIDSKGRENQVFANEAPKENKFRKNINGIWCDYRINFDERFKNNRIYEDCTCWETSTEPKLIYFLDKKTESLVYTYDFNKKALICVDKGIRNNLRLVNINQDNKNYKFFKECDSKVQIWKDDNDKIQCVELPSLEIILSVDNSIDPPRINAPENLPGFYLSKNQSLPILSRFFGYLVFENEEGERHILIPNKGIQEGIGLEKRSYSEQLKFLEKPETVEPYFYRINERGKPVSGFLKNNLYLALLYIEKRDFNNAQKILFKMATKPTGYSKEEMDLLLRIVKGELDEKTLFLNDPKVITLRLKAFSLLLNNQNKPGSISLRKDDEKLNKLLSKYTSNYLTQLYHIPPMYTLNYDEEIALLVHWENINKGESNESILIHHRLNALKELSASINMGMVPSGQKKVPSEQTEVQSEQKAEVQSEQKAISEKSDISWSSTLNLNDTIDDKILDKYTEVVNPPTDFLAKNFLSLYKIAQSKDKSNKERLSRLMAWVNSPENSVKLAEIIEGVLRNPAKFPSFSELRKKFENKQDRHIAIESLYSKSGPREHWRTSILKSVDVQPIIRKKPLPFKEIPLRSSSLEAEQKDRDLFAIPSKESLFKKDSSGGNQVRQESNISLMTRLDQLKSQEEIRKENRVALRGINELKADFEAYCKTKSEDWILQKDALSAFKTNLNAQRSNAKSVLINLQNELRKLANKLPEDRKLALKKKIDIKGKKASEITIKELQLLFVRNNANAYLDRNPALSFEEIQEINAKVANFLILATQKQQLDRISQAITTYERSREESVQIELAHDIYRELSATRAYNTQKHPEFLVFEYRKNILMREEQVEGIERLLDKKQESIQQIIMGGGKSDILLPLIALKKADGDALSMIMVPSELIDTVSESMHIGSGKIFSQVSNRINWKDTSLAGLKSIYERLEFIQKNREFLVVTSKEMHDFSLAIREARLDYITGRSRDERLEQFYKIKKLLKDKGDVLIDEVDTILRADLEVHKALGEEERIEPLYNGISTNIYKTLLTDKRVTEKVYFEFSSEKQKGKGAKSFTAEDFSPDLKKIIGTEALDYLKKQKIPSNETATFGKEIENYEKEIINYIFAAVNEKVSLPPTISNDLTQALASIRGQLHTFLAPTLDKRHNENFGVFPSEDLSIQIAGPYENTQPHFGSQFGHPQEQTNFTIQSYLKTGILKKQIEVNIKRMKEASRTEWATNPLLQLSDLAGYKEFLELFGEDEAARKEATSLEFLTYNEKESEKQIEWIAKTLSAEPINILLYLEKYILPKIANYNMRMTSNAQMLPDMFHRVQGVTGTVEKDKDTFHSRFTTFATKGIAGKTISLLWKNSKDNVQALETEKPVTMLHEMIKAENTELHAIMDAGALFNDISHDHLAREILNIRKDLDAVIFYKENKAMILKRKKDDPLKFIVQEYTTHTDINPSKRFTIFNQPHCTGANIRQAPTASAWITMNKNQNFRDMSQAAWRMRGLDKGQKVGVFLQKGLDKSIKSRFGKSPDTKLDILDPMFYAMKGQGYRQGEDNLKSIRQKLGNVVYQAIDTFLDSINIKDLSLPMCRELNQLTLTILKETPYEQFGTIETREGAQKVLNQFKNNAMKGIEDWYSKYKESTDYKKYCTDSKYSNIIFDMAKLNTAMQNVIDAALNPLQPMVEEQLSTRENNLEGVELSVEVRQEVSQEVAQEQDQEQEQITNLVNPNLTEEPQLSWPDLENIYAKDYFVPKVNTDSLAKSYPYTYSQVVSFSTGQPFKPLISVKDALATAPKGLFNNNLLFSSNLLFTEKHGIAFGALQKPFGPCLIIQSKVEGEPLKMVLLTDEDANAFKQALKKANGKIDQRLCLYYPNVGIYQQGAENVDPQIINNKEFKSLLVQYKFLSGETIAYSPDELGILAKWFTTLGNIDEIKEFFKGTLIKSSTNKAIFDNSPISSLFDELNNQKIKQRTIQIKNYLFDLKTQNPKLAEQWNSYPKQIQNHVLKSFREQFDSRQDFAIYFQESIEWVNKLRQLIPKELPESDFERLTSLYFLAGPPSDFQTKQKNILILLELSRGFLNNPPLINLSNWINSSIRPSEFHKLGPFLLLIHSKFSGEVDSKTKLEYESILKEMSFTNSLSTKRASNFRELVYFSPENTKVFLEILGKNSSALPALLKFRKVTNAQEFNYFIQNVDLEKRSLGDYLMANLIQTKELVKSAIRSNNPDLMKIFSLQRSNIFSLINSPGFIEDFSKLSKNDPYWIKEDALLKFDDLLGKLRHRHQIDDIITLCSIASSNYASGAYYLILDESRKPKIQKLFELTSEKEGNKSIERILKALQNVKSNPELYFLYNLLDFHSGFLKDKDIVNRVTNLIENKKINEEIFTILKMFTTELRSDDVFEKLVEMIEKGKTDFILNIVKLLSSNAIESLLRNITQEPFINIADLYERNVDCVPIIQFFNEMNKYRYLRWEEKPLTEFCSFIKKLGDIIVKTPPDKIEKMSKEVNEVVAQISKQQDLSKLLAKLEAMLK